MYSQKLFLFDFDGVIVNGMNEYWHSSLLACDKFLNSSAIKVENYFYSKVPNTFKEIRPWVKYGWEMVIIVHEIIKIQNPLNDNNKNEFINNYHQNCQKILQNRSWVKEDLQQFLDESRRYQIDKDFEKWVNLHNPFYEVVDFIRYLKERNIKTGIITTKGEMFARQILEKLKIYPEFVFGYEAGTKLKIASKLSKKYEIIGFIEDRIQTLIEIKQNNLTKNIPCFLADWGYIQSSDKKLLSNKIKLLKLMNLEKSVAI